MSCCRRLTSVSCGAIPTGTSRANLFSALPSPHHLSPLHQASNVKPQSIKASNLIASSHNSLNLQTRLREREYRYRQWILPVRRAQKRRRGPSRGLAGRNARKHSREHSRQACGIDVAIACQAERGTARNQGEHLCKHVQQ